MNPFNLLNPNNPMNSNNMNYYRNIYQMLCNSNNPMQMMKQMANNNPQMQPIIDLMNRGASPKDIFIDMCKQRGINPDEFIKQVTGNNT